LNFSYTFAVPNAIGSLTRAQSRGQPNDEAEQLLRLASAVAFRQFASRFGGLMPMWHSRIRLTARVKIGGDD
jgi:hypothetical protein